MFKNKNFPYIILFIVILFHGLNNYVWLSKNKIPPFWDEARYLLMELKYRDLFLNFSSFNFKSFVEIGSYYPPLFPISAVIMNSIFNFPLRFIAMINLIYMLILLFSVYQIGRLIFNKKIGFLASFFLPMFPIIFSISRLFMLDYALTAMVALSNYLLLLTENFRRTKYSVLFGLSLGLGMLTKNTFGVFIIGPLIYIFYSGVIKTSIDIKLKKIINLIYSLVLAAILSIPWYTLSFPYAQGKFLQKTEEFLGYYINNRYILYIVIFIIFLFMINKLYKVSKFFRTNLKWWLLAILCLFCLINIQLTLNGLWYFFGLKDQIGLFFLIIFIFMIPRFFRQKNEGKNILFLWIFVPYCLGSFFNKDIRYTMPYLPAVGIILAASLSNIKRKFTLIISSFLIFLICFFQFYFLSFGFSYNQSIAYFMNCLTRYVFSPEPYNCWIIHTPGKRGWGTEEILRWISVHAKREKITIGLLVNSASINSETLSFYAYRDRLPIDIVDCVNNVDDERNFRLDYLITLESLQIEHWPGIKDVMSRLNKKFQNHHDNYTKVKEFELPYTWNIGTGNKMLIYAKNNLK